MTCCDSPIMSIGQDAILYERHTFTSVAEARWAAFFKYYREMWLYDPLGQFDHHAGYRPQFHIPRVGYLEVADTWDKVTRQPRHDVTGGIEEPAVYLAVGELPGLKQMRYAGWWDFRRERGILRLTAGFSWDSWFPPGQSLLLAAVEAAHAEEFTPAIPLARRGDEPISDITERKRDELED